MWLATLVGVPLKRQRRPHWVQWQLCMWNAYKLLATGHATCTHTHKCMHILRAMALSLQRFLSSIDDICDGDCGECKWNFARTLRHLQVCHISTHMCVCMWMCLLPTMLPRLPAAIYERLGALCAIYEYTLDPL